MLSTLILPSSVNMPRSRRLCLSQSERHDAARGHDRDELPAVHSICDWIRPNRTIGRVLETQFTGSRIERIEITGVAPLKDQVAGGCQIAGTADARSGRMFFLPDQRAAGWLVGRHGLHIRDADVLRS